MKRCLCLTLSLLLILSLALPTFAEDASDGPSPSPACPPHSFGGWFSSGDGHTRTCSACGASESAGHTWDGGTVTTAATCTAAGSVTYTCTACGATKTGSVEAKGHSYGPWASVDGSSHSHSCTSCGATESAAHSFDSGAITTEATCVSTGVKTYTCSGCGATKTDTLPISSTHAYGDWDGNESVHSRTCSLCGKTESGSHSFGSGTTTVAATCLEEGLMEYPCATCGGVLYVILPKLTTHTYDNPCDPDCNICGATRDVAHKYSTVWSRNSRQHWHACLLCGDKQDIGAHFPGPAATEEKPQLCLTCGLTLTPQKNHTHNYSTQWTSDETGHWYACEGCDSQLSFAEHSYSGPCDPDCDICGYQTSSNHSYDGKWNISQTGHWAVCTLCGETSAEEDHIPGPEATEDTPQVCAVCGFELAPALTHTHTPSPEIWQSDETRHWYTCDCGETFGEEDHVWDEGVENPDTTVTYTCSRCAYQKTEGEPKTTAFPWHILLLVCAIVALAAVITLVLLLRKPTASGGRFRRS